MCCVARELRSQRIVQLWQDQLGWPVPQNILDLHAEFRAYTNGLLPPQGPKNSLLNALRYFGLRPLIDEVEKKILDRSNPGGPTMV
jgi:hypothetical protein